MNIKINDNQENGGPIGVDKNLNIMLGNQNKTIIRIFLGEKTGLQCHLKTVPKRSVSDFYPGTYLLPFQEF